MSFFGKPFLGALAKLSGTISGVNYTTATPVPWDAEVYDYGAWHDTVTANTKLIVPAGVTRVRLSGCVSISGATTTDTTTVRIFKNGAAFDGGPLVKGVFTETNPQISLTSAVVEVVAGDYFELQVQVSVDTSISISTSSWFGIQAV